MPVEVQVHLVHLETQAHLDSRVPKAELGQRGRQGNKDLRVLKGMPVRKVLLDHLETKALRVHQVALVCLDPLDNRELLDFRVKLAVLVFKVRKA